MSGAPFLSAFAALKVGAGLVRVAVPEEIQSIVAAYSPELMTLGLESLENPLSDKNLDRIKGLMGRVHSPGCGAGPRYLNRQPGIGQQNPAGISGASGPGCGWD